MATTKYATDDALAVKLWARALGVEALKATPIAPLISKKKSNIIYLKTEAAKSGGDKITYGLRMQLTGDGRTEGEALEGHEEALTTYSDSLFINELHHAVRSKNKGTIDDQRVLFNMRTESKAGLKDWYAKRMSVSFFNQVCSYKPQSDTKYTGLNAITVPSSGRQLWGGSGNTADEGLASGDEMTLTLIDYAKEAALVASPQIRPLMINGEEKYVIYLHPYQVTDLRSDTSSGQWLDIQKAAMQGGQISKNPIYTGSLGEYNGVILRMSHDVTQGSNSTTDAAISTVRRAPFLGAQALTMAYGKANGPTAYKWKEETFEYGLQLGVSVQSIFGMKKCQFNSTDFGVIVVSTYAAAHS